MTGYWLFVRNDTTLFSGEGFSVGFFGEMMSVDEMLSMDEFRDDIKPEENIYCFHSGGYPVAVYKWIPYYRS